MRQSRIVKNHDFGKNRDFRDFFEIFEKNAFFRSTGPRRLGGRGVLRKNDKNQKNRDFSDFPEKWPTRPLFLAVVPGRD